MFKLVILMYENAYVFLTGHSYLVQYFYVTKNNQTILL